MQTVTCVKLQHKEMWESTDGFVGAQDILHLPPRWASRGAARTRIERMYRAALGPRARGVCMCMCMCHTSPEKKSKARSDPYVCDGQE